MAAKVAVLRDWPTQDTRVYRPYILLALAMCLVFVAAGAALFAFSATVSPPPGMARATYLVVRTVFTALVSGVGIAVFVAIIVQVRRNPTIQSAAEGVLPEVPVEPVNDNHHLIHERLHHKLVSTESGWTLAPDQRSFAGIRSGVVVWCTVVFMAVVAMIWLYHPSGSALSTPAKVGMSVFTVAALSGVSGLFWWIVGFSRRSVCRIDIDLDQDQLNIGGHQTIKLEQVLAVQICSLRIKAGGVTPVFGKRGGHSADALEINLVYRGDSRPLSRETLFVVYADHYRTIRLAEELAERLGVPLLNHATRMHWMAEKERARERPWSQRTAI